MPSEYRKWINRSLEFIACSFLARRSVWCLLVFMFHRDPDFDLNRVTLDIARGLNVLLRHVPKRPTQYQNAQARTPLLNLGLRKRNKLNFYNAFGGDYHALPMWQYVTS